MDWDAFFTVHQGLPREGPGSPDDVAWACALAGLSGPIRVCDAGCGPGSDIAALADALPDAGITGVEKHPGFVTEARARFAGVPRVEIVEGDMADLPGAPYGFIWCAGALYFLGLEHGLATMHAALEPGGVLAFSEPCYFTDTPGQAVQDLWEGYPTRSREAILQATRAAGFEVLGHRPVPDDSWEAYFRPMEARIATLRPTADEGLSAMLDLCAEEAERWRAVREETGYLLTVARLPEPAGTNGRAR